MITKKGSISCTGILYLIVKMITDILLMISSPFVETSTVFFYFINSLYSSLPNFYIFCSSLYLFKHFLHIQCFLLLSTGTNSKISLGNSSVSHQQLPCSPAPVIHSFSSSHIGQYLLANYNHSSILHNYLYFNMNIQLSLNVLFNYLALICNKGANSC